MNFPHKVDLLIVGTGLYESILASAFSCMGIKVLHIDCNSFYGDLWSSFSFQNLNDLIENKKPPSLFLEDEKHNIFEETHIESEQEFIKFKDDCIDIINFEIVIETNNFDDNNDILVNIENKDNIYSKPGFKNFLKLNRFFNIDISPKILLGGSNIVDILLRSTTSKYLEFQRVTKLLTLYKNQLIQVPCNRSEIFKTNQISLPEKRLLMKYITYVLSHEDKVLPNLPVAPNTTTTPIPDDNGKIDSEQKFGQLLDNFNLTPALKHYVTHAVSRVAENRPSGQGLTGTGNFLKGLAAFQRYGGSSDSDCAEAPELKTPYLFPVYGSGELPQAFCRLGAVYGATYMLNVRLDGVVVDKLEAMVTDGDSSLPTTTATISETKKRTKKIRYTYINGEKVEFNHLILQQKFAHHMFRDDTTWLHDGYYSRAILITDFSLTNQTNVPNESIDRISFLHLLPTDEFDFEINMVELSPVTYCVPANYHLYHVSGSICSPSARQTLEPVVKKIFAAADQGAREPLWTVYFAVPRPLPMDCNETYVMDEWENLTLSPGPDHSFIYSEECVNKIRDIYERVATLILANAQKSDGPADDIKQNDRNLFRYDISKSSIFHGCGDD